MWGRGFKAGTNPGNGRVHIQDNPSATCATKIRPLCEGNVITCVPSTDCSVKVTIRCLKYAVLSLDLLIVQRERKMTWYLEYSP